MGSSDLGLDVAALSDTGAVRAHNEDVVLVAPLDGVSPPEVASSFERAFAGPAVLAVCDGMGGAAAGEVASLEAARSIGHYLVRHHADGDLGLAVIRSLRAASERVYDLAAANPRLSGMGTTATVCAVSGAEAIIGQVGDSRAYLLRNGRLRQLTRDQTLAQLLVERGQLQPEDMDRSFVAGVILQAVGTAPSVDVDLKSIEIAAGDVLLLCSDGLSGALAEEVIREVLDEAPNASLACVRLVGRALEAGATDNVTCVVARVLALDAART